MAYSRPSSYPYPRNLVDHKGELSPIGVKEHLEQLYKSMLENDSRGEYAKDKDTDIDLKELIVRPEWYGAKGDGVHDDTAAFQAAVDSFPTPLSRGVIVLGPKQYLLKSVVNWRSYVSCFGAGPDATILVNDGGVTCLNLSAVAYCVLDGFNIYNSEVETAGSIGIYISGSSMDIKLQNIRILRQEVGLEIHKSSWVYCDNMQIRNNTTGAYGPYTGAGSAHWSFFIYFTNCIFYMNTDGINADNWGSLYFEHCEINANSNRGAQFESGNVGVIPVDQVVFSQCQFDSNGEIGLRIEKREFTSISDTWFSGGRDEAADGLYIKGCQETQLSNVQAINCGQFGIYLEDNDLIQASNVYAHSNVLAGMDIVISSGQIVQLSNCYFNGLLGNGLYTQVYGLAFDGSAGAVQLNNVYASGNSSSNWLVTGAINGIGFDISNCDFGTPTSYPFFSYDSSTFNVRKNKRIFYADSYPDVYTWSSGDVCYSNSPTASLPGWFCTSSGTYSVATDNTGDTDGSTAAITGMTDTSDFNAGEYVNVTAGFPETGPYRIVSKTTSSITLDTNSDSAQNNVTVTTPAPTWTGMTSQGLSSTPTFAGLTLGSYSLTPSTDHLKTTFAVFCKTVTDSVLYVSGGDAYNSGGRIELYGSTHATRPNQIRLLGGKFSILALPSYVDDAAAGSDGLVAGDLYTEVGTDPLRVAVKS